MSESF
jgi:phospholipid-transporting ATPase